MFGETGRQEVIPIYGNGDFLAYWSPRITTIPVLFLDRFRVHKMGSIVNAIQALSMQVEFIPAGCMGLVQPVDAGYNKAFKHNMHDKFLNWMMSKNPNVPIPGSTCHTVTQWIIDAQNKISVETIHNPGRKTGFSYYPENP